MIAATSQDQSVARYLRERAGVEFDGLDNEWTLAYENHQNSHVTRYRHLRFDALHEAAEVLVGRL